MKVLNIVAATLWGLLLLGTIIGVVEPTRPLYGIALSVIFLQSVIGSIRE